MSYEYMSGMGMGKGDYNPLVEGPPISSIDSLAEPLNMANPSQCKPEELWRYADDRFERREFEGEDCRFSRMVPGTGRSMPRAEYCCPSPESVLLTSIEPSPPTVTNGNGNGNGAAVTPAAAEEEPKYLGFTAQQLLLIGGGGFVLYMLAKR